MRSGTTAECLDDFFLSCDWEEAQVYVAGFASVSKDTVRRWKKGRLPNGSELIAVRVLLDTAGYKVTEFSEFPPASKQLARMMAFRVITVTGVMDLLGYTNTQEVYQVVIRGRGLRRDRAYRLERFVDDSKDDLDELIQMHREQLSNLMSSDTSDASEVPSVASELSEIEASAPVETQAAAVFDEEAVAQSVVHLIGLLLSMNDALGSESASREWRRIIRFAVGDDKISRLIDSLDSLLEQ